MVFCHSSPVRLQQLFIFYLKLKISKIPFSVDSVVTYLLISFLHFLHLFNKYLWGYVMWQELFFTTLHEWIMNNQFEHAGVSVFPIQAGLSSNGWLLSSSPGKKRQWITRRHPEVTMSYPGWVGIYCFLKEICWGPSVIFHLVSKHLNCLHQNSPKS